MVAELHPSGIAGASPAPRGGRRRRRWRRALLAVALLAASTWVARDVLLFPLLVRLIERTAAEHGWKLEIESLESLSLRTIGARGSRAEPLDPLAPVRAIQAREIVCEIVVADLLRGRASGLREIRAEGVEVDLDLTRSAERPSSGGGVAIELPAFLPRLDVSRSSLRLDLPNGEEVRLEDLEVHAGPRGETQAQGEAPALHADIVVGRVEAPWSIGRLGARLELSAVASSGELRIESAHITSNAHRIEVSELRVPLAFEDAAALLRALGGEIRVETPDPVELALGRVLEPRIAGQLGADLRLQAGSLVLAEGAVAVPGGSLSKLRGNLDLVALVTGGATAIDVEADANLVDLAPWGAVLGLENWTGELRGRARLSGELVAPRLAVTLAGDGVSLASRPLGAVALEARTDFRSIHVDSFEARGDVGELTLSGGVDLVAHELANAQVSARLLHPELVHAAIPAMELVLDASLDGPWIALSGAIRARAPQLELAGTRVEALLLDARLREGRLDVESLVGTTAQGSLEARGSLDLVRRPRSIELEVASFDRAPELERTEKLVELCASLPEPGAGSGFDPESAFSLLANARWPAGWIPPSLLPGVELELPQDARVELDLAGSMRAPRGALTIAAPEMRLAPTLEGADSVWTGALDARVRVDEAIVLEELEIASGTSEVLRASGRSALQPDLEELVASRGGSFLDAPCELDVRGELSELSWLARLSPAIRRTSGVLTVDAHAEGTPRALRPTGTLRVREGELRLATSFPVIEHIEGDLALEDRRIRVEGLAAEIGSAPVLVSGEIDLEPPAPKLDLTVHGESVLLARTSSVRLRTDADLRIGGTLAEPRLAGKIDLQRGRIRRDVQFLSALQGRGMASKSPEGFTLFSLRDPPLSALTFDVEINSSEAIEIDSNVVRGTLRPALRLAGTGAIPTLEGRIFLDDLVLYLPGGHFRFPGGWIQFDRADPFHPTLELNGKARLAGHDVTMAVSGTLEEPTVDLSSSPPLARDRLLLLVISGVLPPEDLRGSGNQATRSITLYVAKDMVSRWLSSGEESDDSLFDRLEIVTGSEVSQAGVLSTEASLRLREGTFVKDDSVLLVAERDVYEDYNMGVRIVFHFR